MSENKEKQHYPSYKISNKALKLYMMHSRSHEERQIWSEIANSQAKHHKKR